MKVVRIIFFCLIVFLALPEFVLGVPSVVNGIRAHGDVWSVRHDYFTDAAVTIIPGLLAVGFAAWGAFWPGKTNWLRFLVATSIVFLMAVSIPSWHMPPAMRSRSTMISRMRKLGTAVESWGNDHGKLPLTDAELKEAASAGDVLLGDSPFQRGSQPVQYEFMLIPAATGPALGGQRPGRISYAVDAAGRHYFITGTELPAAVAQETIVVTESGNPGLPLIITGALEPPVPAPPTPSPKPAKKK